MGISQETLNAVLGMIGIVLANFVWTIITTIRAGRVQKRTQQDIAQTKQAVTAVKDEVPAQVQSQIQVPLSAFQAEIAKSLADVAGVGSVMSQSLRDQGANYQDLVRGYQEQLALSEAQLNRALDQNKQIEKQLFDHRLYADELQKARAADFEKMRALELKQRQMEEIQQAQTEGSKARDKRIKELQDHLDEERRQASEQRAEQLKLMDVMRNEREAERQRLTLEVADLRGEVDRLRGIEGERQLLVQNLAALQEQSDGDRKRLTELLAQSERYQHRITELEQEVARLKSLSNGNSIDASSASPSPQVSHERSD